MKKLAGVFLMLGLSSCFKEEDTLSCAYLTNATVHNITVLTYKFGAVLPDDTLKLGPNDTLKIAESVARGLENHAGFISAHFSSNSNDSGWVIYDGVNRVSHYGELPQVKSNKYVVYQSLRNIFNYLSYSYTYKDLNKRQRQATYIYTFTDSDYVYATQ